MGYRRYPRTEYAPLPPPSPRAIAGAALALLALLAALAWPAEKPERARAPLPAMAPQAQSVPAATSAASAAGPARPVYRYSVIPGGVRSAAELALAIRRDRVVAAHYADFDAASAHLVRVGKPRFVHVSYRIGDTVYWTRKKVRLAAGEYLLSDGKHLARTRCGNRIADEVQGPVLELEPASEVLDLVLASAEDLVKLGARTAAGNPPAPVPEPGSVPLVGIALVVLALVRRNSGRKRRG